MADSIRPIYAEAEEAVRVAIKRLHAIVQSGSSHEAIMAADALKSIANWARENGR